MSRFILNVLLALLWVLITQDYTTGGFLLGFLLGTLGLIIAEPRNIKNGYGRRLFHALLFIPFYALEVVLSSLRVARDVLHPRPRTTPAVVAVPLEDHHTPASITVLANLITMTPGTMSLDVSDDHKWLYIHAVYAEDVERFRREFKHSFERRVLKVMV